MAHVMEASETATIEFRAALRVLQLPPGSVVLGLSSPAKFLIQPFATSERMSPPLARQEARPAEQQGAVVQTSTHPRLIKHLFYRTSDKAAMWHDDRLDPESQLGPFQAGPIIARWEGGSSPCSVKSLNAPYSSVSDMWP
jgi:hypothetical protein